MPLKLNSILNSFNMAGVCSRTLTLFFASIATTSILLPYPKDHILSEAIFTRYLIC